MVFKIFFSKVEYEGELRISQFNLFQSIDTEGKNIRREKIFLTLI